MEYFDLFLKAFNSLSGAGFLIGIIVAWKTGLLQYLTEIKKNGNNGNGKNELQQHINEETKDTLKDHSEHLLIANREMGVIKASMQNIEKLIEKHSEDDKEMFEKILDEMKDIKKAVCP